MRISHLIYSFVLIAFVFSCKQKPQNDQQVEQQINQPAPEVSSDVYFDAALNGDIITVENALSNGTDVNTTDVNGRTALMLAAYNGHEKIVQMLVNKEAKVDMVDQSDRTALMFASSGPFTSTVKTLIEAGASLDLVDKEEHWTALMFAASEGHMEVVKILVEKGADVKWADIDGETAYDFALANQHVQVADFIKSKM